MKVKHLIAIIFLFTIAISACKKETTPDEDPAPVDKKEQLYNKWWYNVGNQGRGNHYFNSNGTVEMTIPQASGTWQWSLNDSLIVTMDGYPPITLWFSKIEANTMEYWPTFEPEGNLYQFSTVKP